MLKHAGKADALAEALARLDLPRDRAAPAVSGLQLATRVVVAAQLAERDGYRWVLTWIGPPTLEKGGEVVDLAQIAADLVAGREHDGTL